MDNDADDRKRDDMNKAISIAGIPVGLDAIGRDQLRGLSLDLLLSFRFYKAEFNKHLLCFAEKSETACSYSPMQYARTATLVERILNIPVVFLLHSAPFYIRQRLIEKGVYFIVSDRYVFLPGMLINERIRRNGNTEQQLSPVAQYVLLNFLLHPDMQEFTIQEMQLQTPYNYLAVSRAINELENKQLFRTRKEWKTKLIYSPVSRKELWNKAMPYLTSPVKKTVYSDEIGNQSFYIGGISALSHYSFLNPDDQTTLVVWERDFVSGNHTFSEWESSDFKYKIEVWKYAPEMKIGQRNYVDKLSLYLSLRNDNDPRVEKELENIINEIWQ